MGCNYKGRAERLGLFVLGWAELEMAWTFGHAVREVERSHDRIVVEESATVGVAILFLALALFSVFSFGNLVGIILAVGFTCLGLYAFVSSSFVVDRESRGDSSSHDESRGGVLKRVTRPRV